MKLQARVKLRLKQNMLKRNRRNAYHSATREFSTVLFRLAMYGSTIAAGPVDSVPAERFPGMVLGMAIHSQSGFI